MIESFDNQVIFKLATIETQVKAMSESLGTAIHRLEDKIADGNKQQATETAKLAARVDSNERRLKAIEDYKSQMVAKISGVVSVIAIFWMMFGKAIEQQVQVLF